MGQIPRCKQDTPKVIDGGIQFIIGKVLADFFRNGLSIDELLDFAFCFLICFFDKSPDNIVAAGIGPIVFRWSVGVGTEVVAMLDRLLDSLSPPLLLS